MDEELFDYEDIDSSLRTSDEEGDPELWFARETTDDVELFDDDPMDVDPPTVHPFATVLSAGPRFEPVDVAPLEPPKSFEPKSGRGGARTGAGRPKGSKTKDKTSNKRLPRSEYFTFTVQLNMDFESSVRQIRVFDRNLQSLVDEGLVGFHSVGHEIAPQSGRHHLQGYLETSSNEVRWTFEQFKEQLAKDMDRDDEGGIRIWAKQSRGSATENLVYTGKAISEGRYYRRSEPDVQFRNYGRGNKLGRVKAMIDAGTPMIEIAKSEFDDWCKHRAAFKEYKELTATPRTWPTKLTWIHGSTGKGKSQLVLEKFPPSADVYWLDPPKNGNIWWDFYDGHQTVVVDEVKPNTFGLGHAGFAYVLRLLDSTPLRVGVHGGKVNFAPRHIVFTANFPPSEWFPQQYCDYAWDETNPLFRRFRDFADIILFKSDPDYWHPSAPPADWNTVHSGYGETLNPNTLQKKTPVSQLSSLLQAVLATTKKSSKQ